MSDDKQQARQALIRAIADTFWPSDFPGDAKADARAIVEFLEECGADQRYLTHWLAPLWLRKPAA